MFWPQYLHVLAAVLFVSQLQLFFVLGASFHVLTAVFSCFGGSISCFCRSVCMSWPQYFMFWPQYLNFLAAALHFVAAVFWLAANFVFTNLICACCVLRVWALRCVLRLVCWCFVSFVRSWFLFPDKLVPIVSILRVIRAGNQLTVFNLSSIHISFHHATQEPTKFRRNRSQP